jgi:hypothetical protein
MRAPDTPFQPVTADDIGAWLAFAQPGQHLVYHVGNLARDRARQGRDGHLTAEALKLDCVADTVWKAREAGGVSLAQIRGVKGCEYLVIKR